MFLLIFCGCFRKYFSHICVEFISLSTAIGEMTKENLKNFPSDFLLTIVSCSCPSPCRNIINLYICFSFIVPWAIICLDKGIIKFNSFSFNFFFFHFTVLSNFNFCPRCLPVRTYHQVVLHQ